MEQFHGTWGERVVTFKDDYTYTTILWLDPHKRCSWHRHDHSYNQFFVISGELGVVTDKGYVTHLKAKQFFTVEPGVYHEFQTYKDGAIIEEIAYVKYDKSDIYREQLGGDLEGSEKQRWKCTCGGIMQEIHVGPNRVDHQCNNCGMKIGGHRGT